MEDNFRRLQTIVAKQLGINSNKIKAEADFNIELGADSLDVVQLVMAIEDQAANKILTVQDVLDYIEGRWAKI